MKVFLKGGKDRSIRMGNPWIFSGAVAFTRGESEERNLCTVYDSKGDVVGLGYYNDKSAICVRMLTIVPTDLSRKFPARSRSLMDGTSARASDDDDDLFDSPESDESAQQSVVYGASAKSAGTLADPPPLTFTADDLRARIRRAIDQRMRDGIFGECCRLINAEGDFLPGLIVDRYGDGVCLQIGTAGMEVWREEILGILNDFLAPSFIYERSDIDSRKREGLSDSVGVISGSVPEPLVVTESGVKYGINLGGGQKTGFFIDQRDNRALLRRYCTGRNVLDCFSYTGGFALNAALGGAKSVRAVDISADAGRLLSENVRLNNVDIEFTEADVFSFLREPQPQTDLIILDPPKFARHAGEADKAARGYKDINLAAMKMLEPGGVLFTFSCSGAVGYYLFRQIIYAAAADAGRQIQMMHVLSAGADHPVNIAHKEGEYLKGLVLRVY